MIIVKPTSVHSNEYITTQSTYWHIYMCSVNCTVFSTQHMPSLCSRIGECIPPDCLWPANAVALQELRNAPKQSRVHRPISMHESTHLIIIYVYWMCVYWMCGVWVCVAVPIKGGRMQSWSCQYHTQTREILCDIASPHANPLPHCLRDCFFLSGGGALHSKPLDLLRARRAHHFNSLELSSATLLRPSSRRFLRATRPASTSIRLSDCPR